jgi:hypothetical protein
MKIPDLAYAVSLLTSWERGEEKYDTTGFFYQRDDLLHLVTARHNLYDEQAEYDERTGSWLAFNADKLVLHLHPRTNPLSIAEQTISVRDGRGHPQWRELNEKVDLAVLLLDGTAIMRDFVVKPFTRHNLLPEGQAVAPGEQLLSVGYPHSFYDAVYHLPVFRHTTLASVFGVPFEGNPEFLTDGMLPWGSSGSPVVLLRSRDGHAGPVKELPTLNDYYLLGIHTGDIDTTDDDDNGSENEERWLDLNSTIYATVIEDILAQQ